MLGSIQLARSEMGGRGNARVTRSSNAFVVLSQWRPSQTVRTSTIETASGKCRSLTRTNKWTRSLPNFVKSADARIELRRCL